jgi:hypothetical protein
LITTLNAIAPIFLIITCVVGLDGLARTVAIIAARVQAWGSRGQTKKLASHIPIGSIVPNFLL